MSKNKNIDWLSESFKYARENGECLEFCIGLKSGHEQEIKWSYFDHAIYDGIGALSKITGKSIDEFNNDKLIQPKCFQKIKAILSYFKDSGLKKIKWSSREFANNGKIQIPDISNFDSHLFSKIKDTAKKEGVSVNTFLLYCLDKVIKEHPSYNDENSKWMIPVNMRGVIEKANLYSNHVSYISCDIEMGFGKYLIHEKIKKQLQNFYHFGCWFGINIGKYVGRNILRKFVNYYHDKNHSWTGVFSGLGKISVNEFDCLEIYFCPPVTRAHPVACGVCYLKECLTVSIQVHPSLKELKASELIELFKSRVYQELASV